MSDSKSENLLSQVLRYLEQQFDRIDDDQIDKLNEAGDLLVEDEERAEIIIQAVAAVLKGRDKKSLQEKAAAEICDFIAADEQRAELIQSVAAVLARKNPRVLKTQSPAGIRGTSVQGVAVPPRLRGALSKTAYECIRQIEGVFTVGTLVEKIRSAGYQFFGHPDVSVNTILQKFVKDRLVQVVESGAGRRPRTYKRRMR